MCVCVCVRVRVSVCYCCICPTNRVLNYPWACDLCCCVPPLGPCGQCGIRHWGPNRVFRILCAQTPTFPEMPQRRFPDLPWARTALLPDSRGPALPCGQGRGQRGLGKHSKVVRALRAWKLHHDWAAVKELSLNYHNTDT